MNKYPHLFKVEIATTMLVGIGGFILSMGIGNFSLGLVAILGSITAFVIVDRGKWFELKGWAANGVLISILFFSMRDFFGGSSTTKLIAVANLLVYLQIALNYQSKTPRLGWQIIVLSILQIVLASVFNFNFENGGWFLLYFVVLTGLTFLQLDFRQWQKSEDSNKLIQQQFDHSTASSLAMPPAPVLAWSKIATHQHLPALAKLMSVWLAASILFSFLLFHSLPRSTQEWKSPTIRKFIATGKSKSVDLDPTGVVSSTSALVFRARFIDPRNKQNLVLDSPAYFRGMAMNKYVIKNDATSWEAPYDHVFSWSYLDLPRMPSASTRSSSRKIDLEIILEPTYDPLLYSISPVYRHLDGKSEIEFCRELSAITRGQSGTTDNITSYVYRLATLLDSQDHPLNFWPYSRFKFGERSPRLETTSPEYDLLTDFEIDRYPTLVQLAEQISGGITEPSDLDKCQAMLAYFNPSNRFRYTTDYSSINRDRNLDPIEDFILNHRNGHCSLYATALVLMLRSQGIPARYVVGFHGGKYNNLTDCYVVHGQHAHAWVEAYIPPEDCSNQMLAFGTVSETGAWLTLDPTPPSDERESNEAFDLARTLWQDYVVSPDQNKQQYSENNRFFLTSGRDSSLNRIYKVIANEVQNNLMVQIAASCLFALIFIRSIWTRKIEQVTSPHSDAGQSKVEANGFGARLARIAPRLASWMFAGDSKIGFYRKFEKLITRQLGLTRLPQQTQREFCQLVVEQGLGNTSLSRAESQSAALAIRSITDGFYQVRFGPHPLDKTAIETLENQLRRLEGIFKKIR